MFDHGALDKRTISMIPRSASLAAAFQLDLDRLYAEIRATVGRTDRRSQTQFDLALANAAEFVGMDFVDELLPHLGDQWVFYVDNQIGGPGMLGTVVGNRLKDPENAERALRAFAEGIAKRISHYLAAGEMSASLRTVRHDQIDIQYVSLPLIAPAWTVHNGNLYMGLYPQTVADAARHVADEKPSIITNLKCRDLMTKLKPSDIASMQFIDVPALGPHGYAATLMAAQTVFGFADLVGAESPPMVIPPLHEILPHLAPAGSVTWSDENGFHMRSLTPFPGAATMATMHITSNAQIAAVLFGITVPAAVRAQEVASRRMTEENMRGIGIAMHAWANANDGRFPPDLGTLVADGYIIAEQVLDPASHDFESRLLFFELNVTRLDDIREWINQNTDYVYLGHYYDVNPDPRAILLYEKLTRDSPEGIHFLFANSNLSFLPMDVTIEVLQQLHQPIPGHNTLEDYR